MIDCTDLAVHLFDYAMDDLADDIRAELDEHLAACAACSQLVAEYQAVSHMVHDALEVDLSEAEQAELDAAVLEAIKHSA